MTKNSLRLALIGAASFGVSLLSATAQNTQTGPGDLYLTIQNPGGSNSNNSTIVRLGVTSTTFRDATPGSFTSLASIGTVLTGSYGSGWANDTNLWIGAVANRGTSDTLTNLLTLDPQRTVYVTKARTSIGTLGSTTNSVAISSGAATGVASSISAIFNAIETIGSNTTVASFTSTTTSLVDDYNPVSGGIQQTGYGGIADGVQGNFASGTLGTYGSVANVELALDLFRVQFLNNISGQYGFGEAIQTGKYLGTITIDSNGDIGFTAVPEPSTYAMLGIVLGMIGSVVLRRRLVQKSA